MTDLIFKQRWKYKLNGLIQMLISGFWIYRSVKIIYDYQFGGILHVFMIPEWILILETITGFLGVTIGIMTFTQRWTIKKGYIGLSIIIVSGLIAEALSGLL
jgi:hypothetical protein